MKIHEGTISQMFWWTGLSLFSLFLVAQPGNAQEVVLKGRVVDPQGKALPGATLRVSGRVAVAGTSWVGQAVSGGDGGFELKLPHAGHFDVKVEGAGFRAVERSITTGQGRSVGVETVIEIRMSDVAPASESITVTADVNDMDVLTPDPAVKVFSSENLLDANPGRPGAPVSIPGYPIETASSGIKAPQYFAPGVAGDHGEPIAQYIQVGSYLVPNNLSANAHGNGYADPNIYIASVIESVQVDGGAYNVREGNHALNLAAIYGLRSHLNPFLALTGDYRDITATAGMSPSANSWVAMEGSFGNGFLDRLEHRKQFKFNGGRMFHAGDHTLALFGIAYLGYGYMAGLKPIYGFNSIDAAAGWMEFPDTIDPRQKEQTHTALVALNDGWRLDGHQELQLSGFFRTYNLSLFSDFGLGLIRQSEFRTVTGGNATYVNKIAKAFTLLGGMDYEREAPRRDDLDHYNFYNHAASSYYGPFVKIAGNNVTIAPVTPYVAGEGELGKYVHYYLGLRRDVILIDNDSFSISNQYVNIPAYSSSMWVGVNSPKATITIVPEESWYVPLIAFSFGKSFFTEDPRIGVGTGTGTSSPPVTGNPVETARSYQLVASKTFNKTDVKLTLGHETQTAEYGKIDPDQGLQFNLGPGRIRYLAFTLRQSILSGSLQATFEQADARLASASFSVVPEAPRLIGDITGTYQKLPFHFEAKGEFEYVGRKVVGTACDASQPLTGGMGYCLGVPNKEFRLAVARPLQDGRINVGVNMMIASGWTGQTTENFAAASAYGAGKVGLDPSTGLVPENPVSEVVGVRIPSYASISLTYRFGRKRQ
ncbi:MAG: carboxypeptidase-like regulatory domain-containing protein [Terriglobales bacterium]